MRPGNAGEFGSPQICMILSLKYSIIPKFVDVLSLLGRATVVLLQKDEAMLAVEKGSLLVFGQFCVERLARLVGRFRETFEDMELVPDDLMLLPKNGHESHSCGPC